MNDTLDFELLGEYSTLLWGYSWLEIETYLICGLEKPNYNREILFNTLLRHNLYHRSYQTPKVLDKPSDVHGPFEIAKLSPDNFKQITVEQFSKRIDEIFNSEYGLTPNENSLDIARRAETRWLLEKLPNEFADYYELDLLLENEQYHHEHWWILTTFHEFIIIDRSTNKLYMCVICED